LRTNSQDVDEVDKKINKKLSIRNIAPNCVQKNIKYAASIARRVFANLYRIKKEGIRNISYAKKKVRMDEEEKNKKPAAKIIPI
jgi:hypothetical protein